MCIVLKFEICNIALDDAQLLSMVVTFIVE